MQIYNNTARLANEIIDILKIFFVDIFFVDLPANICIFVRIYGSGPVVKR